MAEIYVAMAIYCLVLVLSGVFLGVAQWWLPILMSAILVVGTLYLKELYTDSRDLKLSATCATDEERETILAVRSEWWVLFWISLFLLGLQGWYSWPLWASDKPSEAFIAKQMTLADSAFNRSNVSVRLEQDTLVAGLSRFKMPLYDLQFRCENSKVQMHYSLPRTQLDTVVEMRKGVVATMVACTDSAGLLLTISKSATEPRVSVDTHAKREGTLALKTWATSEFISGLITEARENTSKEGTPEENSK